MRYSWLRQNYKAESKMDRWKDYFDEIYLRVYKFTEDSERIKCEVDFIENVLELKKSEFSIDRRRLIVVARKMRGQNESSGRN